MIKKVAEMLQLYLSWGQFYYNNAGISNLFLNAVVPCTFSSNHITHGYIIGHTSVFHGFIVSAIYPVGYLTKCVYIFDTGVE